MVGPILAVMITRDLPPESVMREAFLGRDTLFEGVFVTGVHTTGIFCRPTCPANTPRPENVSFLGTPREVVLVVGYGGGVWQQQWVLDVELDSSATEEQTVLRRLKALQ